MLSFTAAIRTSYYFRHEQGNFDGVNAKEKISLHGISAGSLMFEISLLHQKPRPLSIVKMRINFLNHRYDTLIIGLILQQNT